MVDRGNHQGLVALGRLKAGVAADRALAELRGIEADLAHAYPDTLAGLTVSMDSLKSRLVNQDRDTLLVLFGAVGILLLIACINVANLLIARGASSARARVRAALGQPAPARDAAPDRKHAPLGGGGARCPARVRIAAGPDRGRARATPPRQKIVVSTPGSSFAASEACIAVNAFPAATYGVHRQQSDSHAIRGRNPADHHRLRRGLSWPVALCAIRIAVPASRSHARPSPPG